MTSFSISEDGQLYSALTSNNTCALLDVGVSQGKAAWEFLLEDDSPRCVYCTSQQNTACVVLVETVFESPNASNANRLVASIDREWPGTLYVHSMIHVPNTRRVFLFHEETLMPTMSGVTPRDVATTLQ